MGRTVTQTTQTTRAGVVGLSQAGPPDGRTALLIHGVGVSSRLWHGVMEALPDSFHLVAPDLPLHGATPATPDQDFTLKGLAIFVEQVAEALHLSQYDLVANDTGGAIAQLVAARNPQQVRSLVLTNCDTQDNMPPPAFAPTVELAAQGLLAPSAPALLADLAATRQAIFGSGLEKPEQSMDLDLLRSFLDPVIGTPEQARQFERLLVEVMDGDQLRPFETALRAFPAPALIVWGNDDVFFGPEWGRWLTEVLPSAEPMIELDGARLFFPLERPTELARHIGSFWNRHAHEPGSKARKGLP
jgi:pimeloyl-ACP methyl ester carboxylesterase